MKKNNPIKLIFNRLLKKMVDKYIERKVNEVLTLKYKYYYYSELWDNAIRNGEKRIIKVLPGGLNFICSLDSILDKMVFTNEFENDEILFLNRFLKSGDQFIDIGANSGLFTIIAAKKVEKEGQVFAFEPTDTTFKKLCENIELNKFPNIIAHQLAISSKNENLVFYSLSEGFDAWNSLAKPIINKKYKILNVNAVQIDRLDEINVDFNNSALIKIDIEGWELNALKGGKDLLQKQNAPTLMIEFADEHARNTGTSCKELYKYLESLGYKLYKYDKLLNELVPAPNLDYYYENIIATKKINVDNKRLKMNRDI
jgi:FkbM family methyltransferase